MWSPFEDTFGPTLQNLKRHQELVGEQATAAHMDVTQSNILQKDLEKWLDPADYSWDCDLVEGTGAWLIQENTIHAWLDLDNSTSRLLWLTGIPGSGKSE